MKIKIKIFSIIIVSFLCQGGFAQAFDSARLNNYLNTISQNNKWMGSVAISQNGQLIYTKSVGFADIENKIAASKNSTYRIGSISKTFTTVLVMKAVEEKKLDLNQTIEKYFPVIKNAGKITIEDLLYHRSGIHNFTDDKDYLTYHMQPKTEKEMVEIIAKGGSDFEPGSKAAYSNSNFVLLTFILEKAFKQSYATLLTKYITKPIGLTNTYFGGKLNVKNNETKSYSYLQDWKVEPATDMSIPQGAGAIVSTPIDLVKFSDALFSGKLLKKESLEHMKTIRDNFGMGLFKIPFYDKPGYGHNGGIDGFTSVFGHLDDGNVSFALISNGSNFNNNDIAIAILSAVYHKPYEIPVFKTYELTSEMLDQYAGTYSSTQIPLKITIFNEDKKLMAQATGQSAFPLESTEKDKFAFDAAGINLEFNPAEKTMILKQGGKIYNFTKE
ncbi:MAG: serine hydrolase domain-containing protein [Ginsengibacter sp.]